MFAIAIIVFREVLEASLIISIVLAASYGVPGRNRWVTGGVLGGVAGAGLVALFAATTADAFQGNGQELLNATVLILAVCMLGWHNIWMSTHASAFAGEAKALGQEVAAGQRPLAALAMITGAATLREGAETVLFVFSVASSSPEGAPALFAGGLIGLAGGVAMGAGLYFGLLRIPLKRLFTVTSWMVLFLAGGLASQAAGFLVQANILPPLGQRIWDSSAFLTESSLPGRILHTLIGYTAKPQGIQLVAFAITIVMIGVATRIMTHPVRRGAAAAAMLVAALGFSHPARADLTVHMPTVEYGELEFEHNGLVTFGPKGSGFDHAQSYTNEIAYGVTPWWMVGLEGELESGGGRHLVWNALTLENTFQLTQPGQYAFNLGFFAEYSQVTVRGAPNAFLAGPIIQKELPNTLGLNTLHTLNVFFSRDVGAYASRATGLDLAWQSVARLTPLIAPGFEYYGFIEDLGHAGRYNQQQHFVGPVLTGARSFAPYGNLKYEVGYLFGLTTATPTGAVRWKLEYELEF
jgi:high-affinity iron transporter